MDTIAPTTQIDSGPPALTNTASAKLEFSGSDAGGSGLEGFQCRLDASAPGAWASCGSPQNLSGLSDGTHRFEVGAIDKAGNVDQGPATHEWEVDTTPPALSIDSGPEGLTNNPSPTFAFSAEGGSTVLCSIDTGTADFGPCSSPGSHSPEAPLPDGTYTFRVRATDAAGNQATQTRSFEVDTASPTAPELTATVPASPANDNTPEIHGSAPAGTTVRLYSGADCSGAPLASAPAAALEAGIEVSVADDASTSFRATASTAAENTSGCSAPLSYLEDSSAPSTSLDSHPVALAASDEAKFEFSGSDAGGSGLASFQCRLDSSAPGAWAACASAKTYTSLAEGGHTFEVRAIDEAANADQSPASFSWSVDTIAPSTQIDSGPAAISPSANASFTFSGSDGGGSGLASFQCRRDAEDWSSCTSPRNYSALAEGPHTFEVRAIDKAGNTDGSAASFAWEIDTKAPTTQLDSGPAALTASDEAKFEFSGSDAGGSGLASFQCRLDSSAPGAWAACASAKTYTELAEGPHKFEVRAIDKAGNADQSPAIHEWSVDTIAPTTQIDSGPPALTNTASAKLKFSGSDAGGSGLEGFQCRLDASAPGAWASCGSPQNLSGLSDGTHRFEVGAIDKAGNVDQGPATHEWEVDTTPPALSIDSGPEGLTNNPSPTFAFSAEGGSTVLCSIDTGTADFGPCSSPGSHSPEAPLPDGTYTFRVRATDAAGNQATQTRSFEVDTASPTAPELTATVPASPANDNTPEIHGSAPAGTTVRLYSGADCSGAPLASAPAAALEAGIEVSVADDASTSFRATASTAAENTSGCSAPLSYLEDSSAPSTSLDSHPVALAASDEAKFEFSGSDAGGSGLASFQCRLDSSAPGAWAACASAKTYTSLAEGGHTFEVRAIDEAANADQSPASFSWSVDTIAPSTQIDSGPAAISPSANASFTFSGSDGGGSGLASFQCRRDAEDWSSCTSPRNYSALAEGPHTFEVRAIDKAGNTDGSAASFAWEIDTKAPTTQLDSGPAALTASDEAKFEFSGSDAGGSGLASFQCRLDSSAPGAWAACASAKTYTELAEGPHKFEVRAIDKAGNADQSPAIHEWSVDTIAPTTQIDSGPPALTNTASAKLKFSGSDAGGSGLEGFQCRLDASAPGAWASCGSPQNLSGLSDGTHRFEVGAIDKAGNVDQGPATHEWEVDTTPPALSIDSGPEGLTNNPSPTFAFSAEGGSTVLCSIDTGTADFGPCSSPGSHSPEAPLPDGTYTFRVRATDAAGNQATQTRSFEVDTASPTAPELTATVPASPANDNTPEIHGSAPAGTTVRLYSGADCSGAPLASAPAAALEAGIEVSVADDASTSFRATASTAAENTSGCSAPLSYLEDSSAPSTSLDSHPVALAASDEAKFEFSGSDAGGSGLASFQCRLDSSAPGAWAACASAKTYTSLAEGGHTFEVRAIDEAANADQSPASFSWSVDTIAPSTQIDSGPAAISPSANASFTFSGSDGGGSGLASFQCRRDAEDWSSCTSPRNYSALAEGPHTFEVRAIDKAGNTDGSPATFVWTVDTVVPPPPADSSETSPGPAQLVRVMRNTKSGTALLVFDIPGPGRLSARAPDESESSLSGKKSNIGTPARSRRLRLQRSIRPKNIRVAQAGRVKVPINLTRAGKRLLYRRHKVKVRVVIRFRSAAGASAKVWRIAVTLRKNVRVTKRRHRAKR